METNNIESLNAETIRAMASEFENRLEELTNGKN
jgi:hypothetical protein